MKLWSASLLALLAAAPLAQAQAQAPSPSPTPSASPSPAGELPTFPAGVELVTVDAVVTDRKGLPVEGLTGRDFVVLEDGKPQQLTGFEAVKLPDESPAPPPRPRVSNNFQSDAEARTGRTFIVVYDDIHMTPFQAQRAKKAVAELLKSGVREGDRVTLLSTGGDAWWSTRMMRGAEELMAVLKRLDGRSIPESGMDRVSEYEAMRIHIFNDAQVMERVSRRFEQYGSSSRSGLSQQDSAAAAMGGDPLVRARAQEIYYQSSTKNRLTLEVLKRILDSMAGVKGRKSLILVSEGFIYDPNLDEFKDALQASRKANMAIYFLDTRGLGGMSNYFSAEFGPAIPQQDIAFAFSESFEAAEGAESLASDSGGFSVKNTNDLGLGIKRIAQESRSYYLLGYNPGNTARDGKFRKIEVKVAGKGLKVRARKGYYAPLDGSRQAKDKKPGLADPEIQSALDSPFDEGAIPLRLTSYTFDETLLGKATALIAGDVDVRNFAFREEDGRSVDTLEFLLVVAHRETGEYFRYDQKVDFKMLPETRQKLEQSWFPILREFELAPGAYQAKLVVRDQNSKAIGSLIHEFEVPALGRFRVSSPVLSDTLQPQPEGRSTTPRPQLLARRELKRGMLFAQFDVYGAAKDPASRMPKVKAGYEVRAKDGTRFTKVEPSLILSTSLGRLSRLVGTPMDSAAAGEYELVLDVTDELTGQATQVIEPFTLVDAPSQ